MVKQRILCAILITGFMIFVIVNQTNAVCCRDNIVVHFLCKSYIPPYAVPHHIWPDGRISCRVHICKDGITVRRFGYCGVDKCNLIGCNCGGGCKHPYHTDEKALRKFKDIYQIESAIIAN